MNFIPSRSYFQDQQICTFQFCVRIPYPSLGRQNYIAPNAHIHKARKHAMHGRDARSAKYSVANRVISRKLYMRSPSFLHHFVGLINTNNFVRTEYFSDSCNVSKVDKNTMQWKNAYAAMRVRCRPIVCVLAVSAVDRQKYSVANRVISRKLYMRFL